ncbi:MULTISPECIES: DUF2726 domain-containing protein [Thiorhodovibrio]|uniref:DUF2726 domain-containing protein n=1 Tax=Thiorhodovibrio TaxID=61593 RepID=UPI001911A1CF|nr:MULTISPECIES: DUF2726 domain-containing protein [Thiorhodovibrio]MBK5968735.1 hypothetical protein [Thiorhodovibrio winogradskyi]WPL10909.1 hypothetical protein Thiosp_00629 [Thiorhodovibrio litoralis]
MHLFYLLLILTIIALANLLLGVVLSKKDGGRVGRLPAQRRRPMLSVREVQNLKLLEKILGEQRRVQTQVPLYLLIDPAPGVSARRARKWRSQLGALSVDLAVLSADATEPLCAILLTAGGKRPRRVRREQAQVQSLCKQADLPVLTLSGDEQAAPEALKERLEELIWPLEERLVADHQVASEDEDALLAGLAVAMRDRSVAQRSAR